MEGAYYKENLYDINHLKEELDKIYQISTDLQKYTKTIHRGPGEFGMMEVHESYDKAKSFMNMIAERYESMPDSIIGQLCLNGGELEWSDYPKLHDWILNKSFELFKNECQKRHTLFIGKPLLTLYIKGGRLNGHRDGKPDGYEEFRHRKPANILIYLNKEYKKEYGGLFVVENEEIVPTFADILFLNFSGESDPFHMVSEVKEDVNRFALLFNVQYENNIKHLV